MELELSPSNQNILAVERKAVRIDVVVGNAPSFERSNVLSIGNLFERGGKCIV